eukprot:355915-Chlamydomonas_euryale.AAC.12
MEPGVATGRSVIKIYLPYNMTFAELQQAPVTITLVLNAKPAENVCNWWLPTYAPEHSPVTCTLDGDQAPPACSPYFMLNTSSVYHPVDLALFSSDETCCPHPLAAPLAPPPDGGGDTSRCLSCIQVSHPFMSASAINLYNACADLATLINASPPLVSLAQPGEVAFSCWNPNATYVPDAGTLEVCGTGSTASVNAFVDQVISNFDVYQLLAVESLGLQRLAPGTAGSSPCSFDFKVLSTCGSSMTGAGACPLDPNAPVNLPGDNSWNFGAVTNKNEAAKQASSLVVQSQTDPNDPNSTTTEIVGPFQIIVLLSVSCTLNHACMHFHMIPNHGEACPQHMAASLGMLPWAPEALHRAVLKLKRYFERLCFL